MSGQPKSNERIRYSPLYKLESCFDLSISFGAEKEVLETQTYYIVSFFLRNFCCSFVFFFVFLDEVVVVIDWNL